MPDPEIQWFEIVEAEALLMQGDIVKQCPILSPALDETQELKEGAKVRTVVKTYDVIIMSQSCDIAQDKLKLILVCPLYTLTELAKSNSYFDSAEGKESLRRGHQPNLHLLVMPNAESFGDRFLVVEFRSVYSVDISYLKSIAKKSGPRNRLKSPYREHLSQAFARFFMRVGLPADIPKFD